MLNAMLTHYTFKWIIMNYLKNKQANHQISSNGKKPKEKWEEWLQLMILFIVT